MMNISVRSRVPLWVHDAQLAMYPAASTTVTYDLGRKVALVSLYRALGGGWNLTDSQWTSTGWPSAVTPSPSP